MGSIASDSTRCFQANPDVGEPLVLGTGCPNLLRYSWFAGPCFGATAPFSAAVGTAGSRARASDNESLPRKRAAGPLHSSLTGFGLELASEGLSPEVSLEITLQHTGGARFVAEARKHRLVIDQPAEDGATDHGMSPSELLLVSLGSCIGQYVAQYLSLRGLSSDGLQISVGADRSTRPLRLSGFRVEVVAPELSDRQLQALEKTLATAGLVHGAIARENAVCIRAGSARASGGGD